MVVSDYPYWPRILRQIGALAAVFFGLSLVALVVDWQGHILRYVTIPEVVVGVFGAALSILLGFRTNHAYARWWEARILWGSLVNSSRSLSRQAISFSEQEGAPAEGGLQEFAKSFIYRQIAFVHALRCSLRRQDPAEEIRPFLDAESAQEVRKTANVPNAILQQMGVQLARAAHKGTINEWEMQRIDQTLSDLSHVLGACERIKNTPLPRQYDYYPEFLIKVYCILLPFIIVDEVGLLTPLITLLVGLAFLILNRIGKNLEDPFENLPYDVPMSTLSRTVEINLRQALGESDTPAPLLPVRGVLM